MLLAGLVLLLLQGNHRSFELLNQFHSPALDNLFMYITLMGHGLFNVAVSLFLFIFLRKNRLSGLVLVTFVISGICAQLLKKIIGAPRPSVALAGSVYDHFLPGISHGGYESFPSGHTTTIFALCMVFALSTYDGRKQTILFGIAMITAYSRIYLGCHFLSDVLAGAVLGSVVSLLTLRFAALRAKWFRITLPGKGAITIP